MITPQTFEQIKQVLQMLNRSSTEGDVRGKHLTTILSYLCTVKREEYEKALSKLTLLLGIAKRYLRENYIDGLEAWEIINIEVEKNQRYIVWNGLQEKSFMEQIQENKETRSEDQR